MKYTHLFLREKFKNYFYQKNYIYYPPMSIINNNNDTLFTIAGMQQFSDILRGTEQAIDNKVCNIQPCLRMQGSHNDLDIIGKSKRHNSFFEMMGTFDFDNQNRLAPLLDIMNFLIELNLPISNLFITIDSQDRENLQIFQKHDLLKDKIVILDNNTWSAGPESNTGFSIEIFYYKKNHQ